MAKSKSKHKSGKQPVMISPGRFMREKARSFPIGDCYCSEGMTDKGICQVIVTRKRSNGNLLVGVFLIDSWCLGVKNCFYRLSVGPDDFNDMIENLDSRFSLNKISYDEAHNMIYGALAFAEEGGFSPHADFATAGYILEEDTDDIPLIEYEFGRDGRRVLVVSPGGEELAMVSRTPGRIGDDLDIITVNDLDNGDAPDGDAPIDPGDAKQ